LVALNACDQAVEWSRKQPDYTTAWEKCKRGDWLEWLLDRLGIEWEGITNEEWCLPRSYLAILIRSRIARPELLIRATKIMREESI
jgi:hypothetical protein